MNQTLPSYAFHPIIQRGYTRLHRWLEAECREAAGYKSLDYRTSIGQILEESSVQSSAFQFYALFPTHFFKVRHTLEQVIGIDTFCGWLNFNPYLCVVDIGCGAGAASAAVLEAVISLQQQGRLVNPASLLFLGVDPNVYSLILYGRLLKNLQDSLPSAEIDLGFTTLHQGIPSAVVNICECLEQQRSTWGIPCLPQALVMQVNVMSPLDRQHNQEEQNRQILQRYLGASQGIRMPTQFGEEEARCYKTIFEAAKIDHMHIVTISTKGYMLPQRVAEMAQAVYAQFHSSQHLVTPPSAPQEHSMCIQNPKGSYWRDKGRRTYASGPFYVDVATIQNADLQKDTQWQRVIDLDNLELAWSRVRMQMRREDLLDDIEIRIFELNLHANLARLRKLLIAYAHELLPVGQILAYNTPKNETQARPRGLSRIEEEILSVAIIQQLGGRVSSLRGQSYAYRLERDRYTEYLYKPYWVLYKEFINDAREAAKQHPQACVLRTDIKAFYTKIIQDRLVELVKSELSLDSRVKWLLYLLLSKELNASEIGHGLVQGGIGSGFYANIYLTPVDEALGKTNEWDVGYFRYVDDIILIIPNRGDLRVVEGTLKSELAKLGVEQNPAKRKLFPTSEAFLEDTALEANNSVLDDLDRRDDTVMLPLWIADATYRRHFQDHYERTGESWWYQIERYRGCLTELGIYITADDLSRKIFRYLYNDERRREDWPEELEIHHPPLPPDNSIAAAQEWAREFQRMNPAWVELRTQLRTDLITLFRQAITALARSPSPEQERLSQRHIRFAAGKLGYVGFSAVIEELLLLFCNQSWVLNKHLFLLEQVARQGYHSELMDLLACYSTGEAAAHPMSEYMRAVVLRALRFLPKNIELDWDTIVYFSTGDCVVEALMATETWLFRNPASPPIRKHHIDAIWNVLNATSRSPSKLRKNYLLLIGRYAPELIRTLAIDDEGDYLMRDLLNLLARGETIELFDYAEPEELRRRYYSGRRKDDRTDLHVPT